MPDILSPTILLVRGSSFTITVCPCLFLTIFVLIATSIRYVMYVYVCVQAKVQLTQGAVY